MSGETKITIIVVVASLIIGTLMGLSTYLMVSP